MNLRLLMNFVLCLAICLIADPVFGQGFGNGGGNRGGNSGGRGGNNRNSRSSGGILIDASGLVTAVLPTDAGANLNHRRRTALAKKNAAGDWTAASDCRKVSLNKLEDAYAAARKTGEPVPTEILQVAGLQRIDYLFVLPESHDLVIAGPAEGCVLDAAGRMVGVESGRPALNLEDFCVVWRTLQTSETIGCSIDPEPARLAALQQFLSQNSSAATASLIEARFRKMPEILGLQNVRVFGVPADSHAGGMLVEADWRMKRISLGLETPGVKGLRSHLAMLNSGGGNSMQRWYFVPLYEELVRSAEGLTYAFKGQRVQLLSEEELTDGTGKRSKAPTTRLSTKAFAKQFTERYPALAERSPLYAELQNLIDWTLVSALIRRDGLADQVHWAMDVVSDPERTDYTRINAPRTVKSLVNAKPANKSIIGLVGGGVVIVPKVLLDPGAWQAESGQRLESQRTTAVEAQRAESHPWWWD
jgi:hypothetical protein